jgi:hypothetical protein
MNADYRGTEWRPDPDKIDAIERMAHHFLVSITDEDLKAILQEYDPNDEASPASGLCRAITRIILDAKLSAG